MNVPQKIFRLAELLREGGLSLRDAAFEDAFKVFYCDRSVDIYEKWISPKRLLGLVNDEVLRPIVTEIVSIVCDCMVALENGDVYLPPKKVDDYGCMIRFDTEQRTNAYYYVVDKAHEMLDCLTFDFLHKTCEIPEELSHLYNARRKLINVTGFTRKGFYYISPNKKFAVQTWGMSSDLQDALDRDEFKRRETQLSVNVTAISDGGAVSELQDVTEAYKYGIVFTEEAFQGLGRKASGVYEYDSIDKSNESYYSMMVPLKKLDFAVYPNESNHDLIEFMIEEVIDPDYFCDLLKSNFIGRIKDEEYVRERLIHGRYDKKNRAFEHLDMEWLYYPLRKFKDFRVEDHLMKKPLKAEKRKVFSLDGQVAFKDAGDIIGLALDSSRNPEVKNLLEAKM